MPVEERRVQGLGEPQHPRHHDAADPASVAAHDARHDPVVIDRVLHRFAHPHVVPRRRVGVQSQVHGVRRRVLEQRDPGLAPQVLGLVDAQVERHVDVSPLQRERLRAGVLDVFDDDLAKERLHPVVPLVALEDDLGLAGVPLQDIRSRPGRVRVEPLLGPIQGVGAHGLHPALRPDRLAVDDREHPGRERGQKRGVGVVEHDAGRLSIHDLDGLDGIGEECPVALDILGPQQGEADVFRRHRVPAREHGVLPELERVGGGIRGDAPGLGQVGLDLPKVGRPLPDEPTVDRKLQEDAADVVGLARIGGPDIRDVFGDDEDVGAGGAGRPEAGPVQGRASDDREDKGNAEVRPQTHGDPPPVKMAGALSGRRAPRRPRASAP